MAALAIKLSRRRVSAVAAINLFRPFTTRTCHCSHWFLLYYFLTRLFFGVTTPCFFSVFSAAVRATFISALMAVECATHGTLVDRFGFSSKEAPFGRLVTIGTLIKLRHRKVSFKYCLITKLSDQGQLFKPDVDHISYSFAVRRDAARILSEYRADLFRKKI